VGPVNGDFHICATSPCTDKGNYTALGMPMKDIEGDPRIAFGTVDMGAGLIGFILTLR